MESLQGEYICIMEAHLNNPVFYALSTFDAHLGFGAGNVYSFDEAVSPFAGFPEDYENGFEELYHLLPAGRRILYATRRLMNEPKGWQLQHHIKGLQFVFTGNTAATKHSCEVLPLTTAHVEEMIRLAALTKPGPFSSRTIEFGYYYGVFENSRLAAMTGQRLHLTAHTEVSAVCTHPDFIGKGYAAALVRHQANLICTQGKIPFLHVRDENERAIALYEWLGFTRNGAMNFYFLKKGCL